MPMRVGPVRRVALAGMGAGAVLEQAVRLAYRPKFLPAVCRTLVGVALESQAPVGGL